MIDSDRIFLRFRGRTLGPFTSSKATEMLQRGQITRLHEVSADGASWIRAEDYYKTHFSRTTATDATDQEPRKEAEKQKAAEEPDGEQWYAHFANQKQGPMSLVVLQQHVLAGSVNRDTLLWRPGLSDWQAAVYLLPNLFPKDRVVKDEVVVRSGKEEKSNQLFLEIVQAFLRSKAWVQLIAFFWILSTLGALVVSGMQFVIALRAPVPGPAAAFLATGFASVMLIQGVILYCGILLLNYSQALTQLKYQRTEADLLHVGNTISRFFVATGVVVLVSVIGGLLLLLLFVLLAATGMEGIPVSTT